MRYDDLSDDEKKFLWNIHEEVGHFIESQCNQIAPAHAFYPQTYDLWAKRTIIRQKLFNVSPSNLATQIDFSEAASSLSKLKIESEHGIEWFSYQCLGNRISFWRSLELCASLLPPPLNTWAAALANDAVVMAPVVDLFRKWGVSSVPKNLTSTHVNDIIETFDKIEANHEDGSEAPSDVYEFVEKALVRPVCLNSSVSLQNLLRCFSGRPAYARGLFGWEHYSPVSGYAISDPTCNPWFILYKLGEGSNDFSSMGDVDEAKKRLIQLAGEGAELDWSEFFPRSPGANYIAADFRAQLADEDRISCYRKWISKRPGDFALMLRGLDISTTRSSGEEGLVLFKEIGDEIIAAGAMILFEGGYPSEGYHDCGADDLMQSNDLMRRIATRGAEIYEPRELATILGVTSRRPAKAKASEGETIEQYLDRFLAGVYAEKNFSLAQEVVSAAETIIADYEKNPSDNDAIALGKRLHSVLAEREATGIDVESLPDALRATVKRAEAISKLALSTESSTRDTTDLQAQLEDFSTVREKLAEAEERELAFSKNLHVLAYVVLMNLEQGLKQRIREALDEGYLDEEEIKDKHIEAWQRRVLEKDDRDRDFLSLFSISQLIRIAFKTGTSGYIFKSGLTRDCSSALARLRDSNLRNDIAHFDYLSAPIVYGFAQTTNSTLRALDLPELPFHLMQAIKILVVQEG